MVRISLSSKLSICDLRKALLSYLYAQQAHDQLVVRLESTDDVALEMLLLFGISYQHLYYQKDNFKYHLQFASTLLDRKKAFICFCSEEKVSFYDGTCEHLSSEEILNNPNPFVIRMKKQNDDGDSFIIMDTHKYPTSVFARAYDDMLQGISHVIQEENDKEDASKEAYIRHALGYDQAIDYTYVAPLHDANSDVKKLLDEGFMPEAITNYLLLLGNTTPVEIFTLKEAIGWLKIETSSTSSLHFDTDRLSLINREHIKRLSDMELSKRLGYACENIGKLAKMYTKEASTTHEIKQKIDAIFAKKEPRLEDKEQSLRIQKLILEAPYFEAFDDFSAYLLKTSGLNSDVLLNVVRFWITGSETNSKLDEVYPLIKNYLKEIVR